MAVKKKGSKWFPVGKSGKLWKTGYATEAKAKKALTQANKYFSSMKSKGKSKKRKSSSKSSKKKKTKKKKTSKKAKKATGGGHTGKQKSRFNPFNKSGVKVVTGALLAVAIGSFFDGGTNSAYHYIVKNHDVGAGLKQWYNVAKSPANPWGSIATGAVVVGAGARVLDVKSVSFVQFT